MSSMRWSSCCLYSGSNVWGTGPYTDRRTEINKKPKFHHRRKLEHYILLIFVLPYFLCHSTTRPVKPTKNIIPPTTDFHSPVPWFISAKLCLKLRWYTEKKKEKFFVFYVHMLYEDRFSLNTLQRGKTTKLYAIQSLHATFSALERAAHEPFSFSFRAFCSGVRVWT